MEPVYYYLSVRSTKSKGNNQRREEKEKIMD